MAVRCKQAKRITTRITLANLPEGEQQPHTSIQPGGYQENRLFNVVTLTAAAFVGPVHHQPYIHVSDERDSRAPTMLKLGSVARSVM